MPEKMQKTFLVKARQWAAKRKLFGAQAFLRYVMLTYLDSLNRVRTNSYSKAETSSGCI